MPPSSNRIWTLKNITNGIPSSDSEYNKSSGNNAENSNNQSNNSSPLAAQFCQPAQPGSAIKLWHIPELPKSDVCEATLTRILSEFEPIIQQRGYNVLSISEMCCCGDGLDYSRIGRRKLRKQGGNVWGYNSTMFRGRGRKTHTIHLRLRHPGDHNELLPWEDVAGTMAHELSHCVHPNHLPPFYKLMEEILEQHAVMQSNAGGWRPNALNAEAIQQRRQNNNGAAPSSAASTFPTQGGRRLGGGGGKQETKGMQGTFSWGIGQKLGGHGRLGLTRLSAREAAARAAESRRRQLERVKKTVARSKEQCVIEILDDDNESDYAPVAPKMSKASNNDGEARASGKSRSAHGQSDNKKQPSSAKKARLEVIPPSHVAAVVDLTMEESSAPKLNGVDKKGWSCIKCTFRNQPMALACSMCQTERSW